MDGFYVFQTIRSVLNWHILRISSGTGKAWNMPEYQNMKRLLYPVYSRNCLSISDYGLGRRLPRILRMNSDKKRSNPLTDDESISVTAHVITNTLYSSSPITISVIKKSIFLIYLKISSRFISWNFICSLTFNTVSQIYPLVTLFSDCHFMSE